MDLGAMNVRITASDEASRVIQNVKSNMKGATQQVWKKGDPIPKNWYAMNGGGPGMESQGGMGGGGGKMGLVNAASSVFLLGQIAKFGRMSLDKLTEASPMLGAQLKLLDVAVNRFLRPLGDAIAKEIAPMTREAIDKAREQAKVTQKLSDQFGVAGAFIGTIAGIVKDFVAPITIMSTNIGMINEIYKLLKGVFPSGNWLNNGGGTTEGAPQSYAPSNPITTPQSVSSSSSGSPQSYSSGGYTLGQSNNTNITVQLDSNLSQIATVGSIRAGG
jgi:hypothetical protein